MPETTIPPKKKTTTVPAKEKPKKLPENNPYRFT